MRDIYITFYIIMLIMIMIVSSCKKEIDGCTDSSAMNYSAEATSNDGSCIFAYDIAQGIWYFDSACPDAPFPGIEDLLPSSVDIEGEGNNLLSLTIESPIGESVTVFSTIDNDGNVNVDEQALFSIDTLGFEVPILVSGNGIITSQDSGDLELNYSANAGVFIELFDFTCQVDLFREGDDAAE